MQADELRRAPLPGLVDSQPAVLLQYLEPQHDPLRRLQSRPAGPVEVPNGIAVPDRAGLDLGGEEVGDAVVVELGIGGESDDGGDASALYVLQFVRDLGADVDDEARIRRAAGGRQRRLAAGDGLDGT